MAENPELEALDQLVSCPGWTLFQSMVNKEWGTTEGGGATFVKAISDAAKADDPNATALLRQIICAQREIHKVMQLVPQRLALLKRSSAEHPNEFVGSRRGSL